jgi:hypothetical protein
MGREIMRLLTPARRALLSGQPVSFKPSLQGRLDAVPLPGRPSWEHGAPLG